MEELAPGTMVIVTYRAPPKLACITQSGNGKYLVHFSGEDSRMDRWVPATSCTPLNQNQQQRAENENPGLKKVGRKRKWIDDTSPAVASTGDGETELLSHSAATKRNIEHVHMDNWMITTWYYSPYPRDDLDIEDINTPLKLPSALGEEPLFRSASPSARRVDVFALLYGEAFNGQPIRSLWVCGRCLKYFYRDWPYRDHMASCTMGHPPGHVVYQDEGRIVREVDGASRQLYCQNLSLLGKLFIESKTVFFDVSNFLFYVMTTVGGPAHREQLVGFFSKEKDSADQHNLACIITFPPYQRNGHGMLMIELSYELAKRHGQIGSPERPLSELGLRSYLPYWVAALVRFLRRILVVHPSDMERISGEGVIESSHGSDGLVRMIERIGTETHVSIRCTITDIARGANLTVDDALFALNECGLLSVRLQPTDSSVSMIEEIFISRQMVDKVAEERNVKPAKLNPHRVLLNPKKN